MAEEQRTHYSVTVKSKRLGVFLIPHDDANRGALVEKFELVDGNPGEVQESGAVRAGFALTSINDTSCEWWPFPKIIALLQESTRPVRLTWKDPDVQEYRDRHMFLRTKMHCQKEAEYLERAAAAMRNNDMAWLDFLKELGGSRGVSWGQRRLVRDALGRVEFPLNPDHRLNALPTGTRKAMLTPDTQQTEASANSSEEAAAMVVSIYRRCWEPGGIGVSVPPGLGLTLAGELPKVSQQERYRARLMELILRGGIPAAFRPGLWWELSGAHAKCRLHPPGYYSLMSSAKASPDALIAIAKDIDRTFPGHPRAETEEFRSALARVLIAFSVHASEIGYCQSLNFLAGFLLLHMSEEQSFWTLEVLVHEILPPMYYHDGLIGVNADTKVLAHLVSELLPDVSESFERAGVALPIVTVEWFMCLFNTCLPTLTALRVWDAVFLLGSEVLFRTSLVLFLQHKDRILSVASSSTKSSVVVRREGGEGTPVGAADAGGPSSTSSAGQESSTPKLVVSSTMDDRPTRSGFLGLGGSKDTVAETAAKALAAMNAQGVGPGTPISPGADGEEGRGKGAAASSSSSFPTSPVPSSAAFARGGTIRSPASTFPALFGMLKILPGMAHDPDLLLHMAYPANPREAKDSLDWSRVSTERLSKLRSLARKRAEEELGIYQSKRKVG